MALPSHPSEAQKWTQSFIEGQLSQMQWEDDLMKPMGLGSRHTHSLQTQSSNAGVSTMEA